MKIRYKTSLLIFVFGIVVLVVLSTVIFSLNNQTLTKQNMAALRQNSQLIADHLETRLLEKAQLSVAISLADQIRDALLESNAVYAGMLPEERSQAIERLNQQWMDTSDVNDPFIQSHMTNSAAAYLSYQQENFPTLFGEIFLTNRYGVMIATTRKLTTLAHAEKYWWQASYFDGEGKIFFDDRGFDTSVDGYVLGIVVPVRDGDEVIGLLKFNFNILELLSTTIEEYLEQYQGNIQIARTGGNVVLESGMEPLSTELDAEVIEFLANRENDVELINGQEKMVGYAPVHITMGNEVYSFGGSFSSIDHIKGNQGEAWHIVITKETPALFTGSEDYFQTIWLVSAIVVTLTSIIAF